MVLEKPQEIDELVSAGDQVDDLRPSRLDVEAELIYRLTNPLWPTAS
jgi:hypothetical protein